MKKEKKVRNKKKRERKKRKKEWKQGQKETKEKEEEENEADQQQKHEADKTKRKNKKPTKRLVGITLHPDPLFVQNMVFGISVLLSALVLFVVLRNVSLP